MSPHPAEDAGPEEGRGQTTYDDAGVSLAAARRSVEHIRDHVRSTFRPEVVGDIGGFGGLFAFDPSRYRKPLLVSATDGAGTKVLVAQMMGVHDTIGIDVVAMSVNDVAAQGAEPLFFLDYIVIERNDPQVVGEIVRGVAAGCRQAGCALIGGEVAEHPGHLPPGSYDLAGFCVGAVDRDRVVTGEAIQPGDVVIGLESSGLHSNGYSLVRKVVAEARLPLDERFEELGCTLGEELLRPTTIYAPALAGLAGEVRVAGLAHITGGGIVENVGRIVPEGLSAAVDRSAWESPPVFDLLEQAGRVPREEMYATFNMGIGMVVVVSPSDSAHARDALRARGHRAVEIGAIVPAGRDTARVRWS